MDQVRPGFPSLGINDSPGGKGGPRYLGLLAVFGINMDRGIRRVNCYAF